MWSLVQIQPDPPILVGGVAQLGERLLCKQEVIGSIPFTSTNDFSEGNHNQRVHKSALSSFMNSSLEEFIGCKLFNNLEEVKVPVRGEPRARACAFIFDRELGLIASRIQRTKGLNVADTSACNRIFRRKPEGSGL